MTSPHLADTARRKYEEVGRGHGTRPSSRDRQNDPICMSQLTAAEVPAAAPNGGYRVLTVTSDGDTALQMLESTSDLIAESALCSGRRDGCG